MRYAAMILALAVAACSGTTGPKGLDPTVRIVNAATDTVVSVWADQSGQVQVDRIPPGVTFCEHFTSTQVADSVRFLMYIRDSVARADTTPSGVFYRPFFVTRSPWFDPKTGLGPDKTQYPFGAEFWTADATGPAGGGFGISLQAVAAAPC